MNAAAEVVGEEGNDLATHEVERKKPCKDFNENYKIQTKELFKPLNINIKCENTVLKTIIIRSVVNVDT